MSSRKLLLADDSITIQKVVNLTFADEGIEVITVGDGDAAMEKMLEIAPDLVMADVNMPGLNGYQVCEKIRQSDALKKTPVILLVGSFEPFDEAEARRVGADDYLTKPFQSIRQLVNKVTDLLNSNQNGKISPAESEIAADDFSQNSDAESSFAVLTENPDQYGDAGMDDEMIQTNHPLGFALDESQKFETRENAESSPELETAQPFYGQSEQQFSSDEATIKSDSEAQSSSDELADAQTAPETEENQPPQNAFVSSPAADDDEGEDLLELGFDEDLEDEKTLAVTEAETQTERQSEEINTAPDLNETAGESSAMPPEQSAVFTESEPAQSSSAPNNSAQLSPEMIDAIAQKVVEKLSNRAVKDVAWEVVPQMADLIIKKMAEERMKE